MEHEPEPAYDLSSHVVGPRVVRDAIRQTVDATAGQGVGPGTDPASSAALVRLLDHLRSTVAAYVTGRRADGAPIERVLPEVKCLAREAASCEQWYDPADTLMKQVVRWTIDAYYDQPDRRHAPRLH